MDTRSGPLLLAPAAPGVGDLARRLAASAAHVPRPPAWAVAWLAERRDRNPFEVTGVPFARLDGWAFASGSGDLVHRSGRFFSVEGIRVRAGRGPVRTWEQPIINQPDVGVLGIVAREIDGVLRFLMQAKAEPGNVNTVQLSPTVQATASNFQRVHGGAPSRYLEYFARDGLARVLVDVLQSEQGAWFRGKRNRNIVVETTGPVDVHEDFAWFTLGELYALLRLPNVVNMDARTVLSCLPLPVAADPADGFGAALRRSARALDRGALHRPGEVRGWLTARKMAHTLDVRPVPLDAVEGWRRDDREIFHTGGRHFTISGVRVRASNREVRDWCQPLLRPRGTGLAVFLARPIRGVLHVLARADLAPGHRDVVEVGPTVQCTPADQARLPPSDRARYLDLVTAGGGAVRYDVEQSEEGGRFQRAVTRNQIVQVDDDFPLEVPPDFRWLTVAQLRELTRASYQVNIEARTLALCLHALR
ncbi:NDP-hexose 2,3-dehydratase family protein [Actinomadura geliboluensis]|uniref:NDP-hexose 2,3-dehydratase family protein n=1 Tax=Actinomadura geliboluensis TaxID=882440 RepID=UPI0037185DE4